MKTKLFIDFDCTIFDTDQLKKKIWNVFEKSGYETSDIDETYKIAGQDYCYSPDKHLKLLVEKAGGDEGMTHYLLSEIYNDAKSMVYPDALHFLENINRVVFDINLLSLGDPTFQETKIKHADVVKYFNHLYITDKQKWDYLDLLVKPDDSFIFIDDRGDSISKVAAKFPNSLDIEINRIGAPLDPLEPIVEFGNIVISSFDQLEAIINHFERKIRA